MKNSAVEKAIAIAGSQKALGERCGKAQSTICDWLNGNKKISPEYVPLLVAATNGEVPAYQFRPDLPDLFPHPEVSQQQGNTNGIKRNVTQQGA